MLFRSAENPYFTHEAADNQSRQSNYRLRSDSPAKGSGKALPLDIARAIDPSGRQIKSGVAVDRGALLNVLMDAGGAAAPAGGAVAPLPPDSPRNTAQHTAYDTSGDSTADGSIAPLPYRLSNDNPLAGSDRDGSSDKAGGQPLTINGRNDNATTTTAASGTMGHLPDKTLPRYDRIRPYSEGFAAVERNGRWGFIDRKGRETVRPQYQDVLAYGESRAAVKRDGRWGFIDTTGKETVKPQYDTVWSYKDGRATVEKDGARYTLDPNGHPLAP